VRRGRPRGVERHQLCRRAQRVAFTVDDHHGAVPDEQGIDGRVGEQPCRPRVIGGDHDELAARSVGGGEIEDGGSGHAD